MPSELAFEKASAEAEENLAVPLGGTRAQAVQRLQVGVFGLAAMILLVGLANIIMDQAQVSESRTVPEAAATVAPEEAPAPSKDPLADAGVVPELPVEPATIVETPAHGPQGDDDDFPPQP